MVICFLGLGCGIKKGGRKWVERDRFLIILTRLPTPFILPFAQEFFINMFRRSDFSPNDEGERGGKERLVQHQIGIDLSASRKAAWSSRDGKLLLIRSLYIRGNGGPQVRGLIEFRLVTILAVGRMALEPPVLTPWVGFLLLW